MRDARAAQWTVVPHERSVIVRLESTPALLEWEPILDEIHRCAEHAAVVMLEGPGWLDPFAKVMESAIRQTLETYGVPVRASYVPV
jgi:hypothetical protein